MTSHVYGATPAAYRVVTGPESYETVVDLTPIGPDLMRAIAHVLVQEHLTWAPRVIATLPPSDPAHRDAMDRVMDAVTRLGALQIRLRPDDAFAFSEEIESATYEPDSCDCGVLLDGETTVGRQCRACADEGDDHTRADLQAV